MSKDTSSSYDEETPDEDLWFLPEGTLSDPADLPWDIADQKPLLDLKSCQQAEANLGVTLANAAAALARLDERLKHAPKGLAHHLTIKQVADYLWAEGNRFSMNQIALYLEMHVANIENTQALSKASWAVRRMKNTLSPLDGLGEFLGRHKTENDGLQEYGQRPVGMEFEASAHEWKTAVAHTGLHPLTAAAFGFYAWRIIGVSEPGAIIEPLVAAGKLATQSLGMEFLPITLDHRFNIISGDGWDDKLRAWLLAITDACTRALMDINDLISWQTHAMEQLKDLSGRTPPYLVNALLSSPLLSTEMAAKSTGASNAACLRNLTLFESRGLTREVTGQGRFRYWAVKLR